MHFSLFFALAVAEASRSFYLSPQATQPIGWLAGEAATERLAHPATERNVELLTSVPAYQTVDAAPRAHLGHVGTIALFAVVGYAIGSSSAPRPTRTAHAPGCRCSACSATRARRTGTPRMIDMNVIIGGGTLVAGIAGGVGVIKVTENAGKRNEERENAQPCVVCKTRQVVDCPVCQGEGRDQYASLVKGMRAELGEDVENASANTVTVNDWEAGETKVEMYADIMARYPVKITGEGQCINCDGRGVIICDNCQGSGLQPRFLERYSPDDFMD